MNKLIALTLCTVLSLISSPVLANKAETMLLPQRIVLEPGERTATLIVKNAGDATGEYTLELIDMNMEEAGGIVQVPTGTPPTEFSAIPFAHAAPRSVTLKPGETQTVRILVRRPEGMAEGEYRSHIKVRIVNDNVDVKPDEKNLRITVKPNLVMIVPLIIRQGNTQFKASLSEPRIKGRNLEVYIGREGNRSAEGNLRVYQTQGGKEVMVGELNGIPVYRPTAKRLVRAPLKGYLPGQPLLIRYEQPEKDGGAVLAETRLTP